MEKLVITVAPTGAEVQKNDNPNVPYTADDIAQEVLRAYEAGASIAHLHARNPDGSPTQNREIYQQIIEKIKEQCDIIIQVSTGGSVHMNVEERVQPVVLRPEMASFTTGSVNFGRELFLNTLDVIERIASELNANDVMPEFEIFDSAMIHNALNLIKRGIVSPKHLHFNFVMGVPGGIPATPKHLMHLVELIPQAATWSVSGIGKYQFFMAAHAILWGGHVRVGFEDNLYFEKGVLATSNRQLVQEVVNIAHQLRREIATPNEARTLLKLI